MNIYENERQRVNERIDKIKNRVITDNEQPISVVFIEKEPVLAEDAKEFKNLKRMLEILDNGLSQKSDWEYLELRNKTGLFSMELRYQSAFRNHDSIIAREKELVEKSIKDILAPSFSKNKVYASDGSYIPHDELYKYEALLGMRDQILNGFDTEDYYEYMSLREQSGLGSLSDNEYLNLMGKESPTGRPYFRFKDNKYFNKPYVHAIRAEKENSNKTITKSEKDNVDLPKRSMDGNAHESKNSSNNFNRSDFNTEKNRVDHINWSNQDNTLQNDITIGVPEGLNEGVFAEAVQPKQPTFEQIRAAAVDVPFENIDESIESDSKPHAEPVNNEHTSLPAYTNQVNYDFSKSEGTSSNAVSVDSKDIYHFEEFTGGETKLKTDDGTEPKIDVAAESKTGDGTEPKTGVVTETKTGDGTEPKTDDGAEPMLDIDPDEELHEVVKSTPWQWAKKHKKVILAVGITAVTITVAVALTQLAPAIGAYIKASQVSNIATGMVKNATSWHTAAAAEKAALHNSNIVLAKKLSEISGAGAVYEKATGVWTIGSTVLPEFAKTATSAVTQAASKILTSSFLTAIPGITGAAALGIAGKRSDEYKKINQHIKNAHGSLKQLPTDALKNAANLIDNEITTSDNLSKHEKSILLRKYRKLLKNINKKEEQEKQQEEQKSQEQGGKNI